MEAESRIAAGRARVTYFFPTRNSLEEGMREFVKPWNMERDGGILAALRTTPRRAKIDSNFRLFREELLLRTLTLVRRFSVEVGRRDAVFLMTDGRMGEVCEA